jgi:hypothetical protein
MLVDYDYQRTIHVDPRDEDIVGHNKRRVFLFLTGRLVSYIVNTEFKKSTEVGFTRKCPDP